MRERALIVVALGAAIVVGAWATWSLWPAPEGGDAAATGAPSEPGSPAPPPKDDAPRGAPALRDTGTAAPEPTDGWVQLENGPWPADAGGVRRGVKQRHGDLRRCWDDAREDGQSVPPQLVVNVTIEARGDAGRVTGVAVDGPDGARDMEDCLLAVFADFAYTAPADGRAVVAMPLDFGWF
jgi:hypothetical protein